MTQGQIFPPSIIPWAQPYEKYYLDILSIAF